MRKHPICMAIVIHRATVCSCLQAIVETATQISIHSFRYVASEAHMFNELRNTFFLFFIYSQTNSTSLFLVVIWLEINEITRRLIPIHSGAKLSDLI